MPKQKFQKYRINEIRLNLDETSEIIPKKIAGKLKISQNTIGSYEIVRQSIDARRKPKIQWVYTIDFFCSLKLNLPFAKERIYLPPKANLSKDKQIVIVGFGPCGIFAALTFAQMGYQPIVIERGKDVDARTKDVQSFWSEGKLNPDSNVQFGEGGAGAFSDGKLTTGINDMRIFKILSEFHYFGADEEILFKQKPHIGTDVLKTVVKRIREEIIRLGGKILFETKLIDFTVEGEKIKAIHLDQKGTHLTMSCDKLILAIGHSARDTFRQCLNHNVAMVQKPFSIGTRIQHPQNLINMDQYGDPNLAQKLGAAEYKLHAKSQSGRGVYTFCMCPGGEVILASSAANQIVSNGMSFHARDGQFANSALLVDVRMGDFANENPLAGVEFQEYWENKAYDLQNKYELLQSDIPSFLNSDLASVLPDFAKSAILETLPILDKKLLGFAGESALLLGPETRSSSPVRFIRDKSFQSNIKNLYPAGEGAGYAGGIMSAAVDGMKVAEQIISEIN